MRPDKVGVRKGDDPSVFMLGKGMLYEQVGTEQFNVIRRREDDFENKGPFKEISGS